MTSHFRSKSSLLALTLTSTRLLLIVAVFTLSGVISHASAVRHQGDQAGAAAPAPAAKGPWLGVWKLNVEKSTFQSNKPPIGTVRTYAMTAAAADSFDILIESKTPTGEQTMHMELKGGKFDGTGYKEVGNPIADTNRFTVTGEHAYEFVESKDGVDIIKVSVEISPDGKTRTSRQQGKGRDGQPTLNIAVWDRVER